MKLSTSTLILALACVAGSTEAWTYLAKSMENVAKGATTFGVAVSLAAGVVAGPSPVNAADFTGSYKDPNHPGCARLVATEGTSALVSGADGNPGCPTGEGRPWKLVGKIDGENIFVDFSPKGGPKNLQGKWETSQPAGIRWPDGNKWVLEGRPN